MKSINIYAALLLIAGALGVYSCELEPDFPIPGFSDSERQITIRRDTVPEIFSLRLPINLNNGVASIEVIDAISLEPLEAISGYEGKTNFDLVYDVDLRPVPKEKDTVFNFLFRVVSTKGEGFNRAVILNVKKLSTPELIDFEGGEVIQLSGPIYKPEGTASTGAVPLKSVEYIFKGEQRFLFEVPSDTLIYDYELVNGVSFQEDNLIKDEPYPFSIVVTDTQGRSYTKELTLVLSVVDQLPSSISYYDYRNRLTTIMIGTDDFNRIDSVYYTTSSSRLDYVFEYGEDNRVSRAIFSAYSTRFANSKIQDFNINYEPDGKVKSIRLASYTVYDAAPEIKEDFEESIVAQRFLLGQWNLPDNFYGQSEVVEGPFYSDPLGMNEPLFSAYYQQYDITSMISRNMSEVKEFKTVFMPTYIEGLPPFIYAGPLANEWFYDLFTRKLMPDKVRAMSQEYKDGGYTYLKEPNYSYTTTATGQIDRMIVTYTQGGTLYKGKSVIYQFNY